MKVLSDLMVNPTPNAYLKYDVSIGNTVKVCDGYEMFCVKVTEIDEDKYIGFVLNDLVCDYGFKKGDIIILGLESIWNINELSANELFYEKTKET